MSLSAISIGLLILQKEYPRLIAQLGRAIRDPMLAQDLINEAVAETLTKLWAGEIQDPRRVSGFVYRVAENLMRNHCRRCCNRQGIHVAEEALAELSSSDDPCEINVRLDLARQIRIWIEKLPASRDRELLRRFYLDEEEKRSICADLGLNAMHFDRVLFRARQRLKQMLCA